MARNRTPPSNEQRDNCLLPDIPPSVSSRVTSLINSFQPGKNLELEASLQGIDTAAFERITRGYAKMLGRDAVQSSTTLDISIGLENMRNYRVTIKGSEETERFIKDHKTLTSSTIRSMVASMKPSETVEIYYKARTEGGIQDIPDLGLRFKMSTEVPYDGVPPNLRGTEPILFRIKYRYSFAVSDTMRLDMTSVRCGKNMVDLSHSPVQHEAELELIDVTKPEVMWEELCRLLRYRQDSDAVVGKTRANAVVAKLGVLLGGRKSYNLRQPVSITPTAAAKSIPTRYGVTDKADGDRHQLYITEWGPYLINTNKTVRGLDMEVDPKWRDTVLDGELVKVQIEGETHRVFLAFDVICHGGIDYRHEPRYGLVERLAVLEMVIREAFDGLVPYPDYTEKHTEMDLPKLSKYHRRHLPKYCTQFVKALTSSPKTLIARKLYLTPYGIDNSEVYLYASLLWEVYRAAGGMPYALDGLIFTPLSAPYTSPRLADRSYSFPEYKWKPPHLNTIDFYVTFKKDQKGNDEIFYEDEALSGVAGPYKIGLLQVGTSHGRTEDPVPFEIDGVKQISRLRISEDERIYSEERDPITDGIVVEYYYLDRADVAQMDRWVPLRVRYDKTEAVRNAGRNYGNNINVAKSIWRTISRPVTFDHILSLADPDTFAEQAASLSETDVGQPNQRKQTTAEPYYQIRSRQGLGARAFNNWNKSNQITNYASGQSVLDVGCGRGGDLEKFYRAGVTEYVGLDIDAAGLFVIKDSALSRIGRLKKRRDAPPMHLVQADARVPFTPEDQARALPHMRDSNRDQIQTYLSDRQYGVVNAQFTLHYYLSDDEAWDTFCANLRKVMAPGGYLLISCFDGDLVHRELQAQNPATVQYVDPEGVSHKFFEIRKMYADDVQKGTGVAIEFFNSLISEEGVFHREYLVFPEFLIQSLWDKCGLRLVETSTFYNMFHLYKDYFSGEDPGETKAFGRVASFYKSLEEGSDDYSSALAGYKLSMLNRYYVFQNSPQPCAAPSMSRLGKLLSTSPLDEYFREHNLHYDSTGGAPSSTPHYQTIRRRTGIRPDVYLLLHRAGHLTLTKIKEGDGRHSLIMYKSPEKTFYPVYHMNDGERRDILRTKRFLTALGRRVALESMLQRRAARQA